jgi:hypothetical protein
MALNFVTAKKKKKNTGYIVLKFEEETSKMLHLEQAFVWC